MALKTLANRIATSGLRLATIEPGSWRTSDQSSTARGYGYRWQKARATYLSKHPLCVMCSADDHVCAATIVDHIEPHRGDQTKFWDTNNWQSLCAHHHSSHKQREESSPPGG